MNIVVGVASEFKAHFNITGAKVAVQPVTFHFDLDLPTITCQLTQTGILGDEVVCSSKQFDFGTPNGGNMIDLWNESLCKMGKFKAADKSGHEKSHCLGICDEVVIVVTLADGRTFKNAYTLGMKLCGKSTNTKKLKNKFKTAFKKKAPGSVKKGMKLTPKLLKAVAKVL